MSVETNQPLSVPAAEALWDDLKSTLSNAERTIVQIINTKAWEPLGYPSFAAAWAENMTGVRLATEAMRVHVVYALYDSGLHDEEVRTVLGPVSGVTPTSLATIRRQRDNGVPPSLATTRVRSYERPLPSLPRTVHVELTEEEFSRYAAQAARIGSSVKTEAEKAIRMHFDRLARESKLSV